MRVWALQVTALLLAGCIPPACGQTVSSLANTGAAAQFSFDGLTFSVSGCTSSYSGGCAAIEMTEVATAKGAEIEFLGNGGTQGHNILSLANAPTLQQVDFTLTIAGTSRTKVSAVSAAVSGTAPVSTEIGASLILNGAAGCQTTGGYISGTSCNPFPYAANAASATFTPTSNLSIAYALGVDGAAGQTVTLSNATAIFTPAPEPASIAVLGAGLGAGLAGLAWARRRTKKLS